MVDSGVSEVVYLRLGERSGKQLTPGVSYGREEWARDLRDKVEAIQQETGYCNEVSALARASIAIINWGPVDGSGNNVFGKVGLPDCGAEGGVGGAPRLSPSYHWYAMDGGLSYILAG